jgi:hypothetical protein
MWGLLIALVLVGVTFALGYTRTFRRTAESPDISPQDRSRLAARSGRFLTGKLFSNTLDRSILLFTGRTIARSRQHRLLLAAYGGIGLALALLYGRDTVYGTYRSALWG